MIEKKFCRVCGVELTEENVSPDNPDLCEECGDNELDEDFLV